MKHSLFVRISLSLLAVLLFIEKAQAQLPVDFSKVDSTETLKSCQVMLQNFVSIHKATVLMEQNFTRKGIAQAFIPVPGGRGGLMDVYLYYFVMADEKKNSSWIEFFTQNGESNQRTSSFRFSNTVSVRDGYIFQLKIKTNSYIRNRRLTSNELQMIASGPGNLLALGFDSNPNP